MSIHGRTPKDPSERINRNTHAFPTTVIKPDGKLRGVPLPPLPDINGQPQEWCVRTQEWWDDYRTSPQAKLMQTTDWNVLLLAAFIHNEIWRDDRTKAHAASSLALLASELRRREDAVGGTFEARAKLRISVLTDQSEEDTEQDIKETAAEEVNYLERMLKKVAEQNG